MQDGSAIYYELMMNGIPDFLYRLYSEASAQVRLYARLRWRLCPFVDIEKLVPKKAKVVDIGCGFGLLANYLALTSDDRQVLGVDLSEKRINSARQTVDQRKNIDFRLINVKDLDLLDCDAVVMTDFLHHISFEQQEKLLQDVSAKLRKGGRLVLQDIDLSQTANYFFIRALDRILNIGKGLFYRDKDSWQRLLERCGFEVKIFYKNIFFLPDVLFVCDKNKD